MEFHVSINDGETEFEVDLNTAEYNAVAEFVSQINGFSSHTNIQLEEIAED
jgi:hypothetical protein